jgi:hypothetical protein
VTEWTAAHGAGDGKGAFEHHAPTFLYQGVATKQILSKPTPGCACNKLNRVHAGASSDLIGWPGDEKG